MRPIGFLFELVTYVVVIYSVSLWLKRVAPQHQSYTFTVTDLPTLRMPALLLPTLTEVHQCLLNVDELHCGSVRDMLMNPFVQDDTADEQEKHS